MSPWPTVAKSLAQIKTDAEGLIYTAAPLTTDRCVQFQVCLSDDVTEVRNGSITDTEHVESEVEGGIHWITLNEWMQFHNTLRIQLIKIEAWCQAIGIQEPS